jgi:hypothetical protein
LLRIKADLPVTGDNTCIRQQEIAMITYNYSAFYVQMRANGDWSNPDYQAFPYRAALVAPPGKATVNELGHLDRDGLFLDRFGVAEDLSDQMVIVTRMQWSDPVSGLQKWTDLIWISLHVYEEINGEPQLVGFDDIYIPLGGAALPSFATTEDWLAFRETTTFESPPSGAFAPGSTFNWADGRSIQSILGSAAGDTIVGGKYADLVFGGDGWDKIYGYGGNDTLNGEGGSDKLWGLAGNDVLRGGFGRDSLYGGADNDTLLGNGGNDWLDGGTGHDVLTGGTEADTFVFGAGYGWDRVTDFNVAEGDRLRLDDALWGGEPLDGFAIIQRFAVFPASNDRVILIFSPSERITLIQDTADGLLGLHGAIDIF